MELEGQSRNPAIILSKGPLAEQIFRAKLDLVFLKAKYENTLLLT